MIQCNSDTDTRHAIRRIGTWRSQIDRPRGKCMDIENTLLMLLESTRCSIPSLYVETSLKARTFLANLATVDELFPGMSSKMSLG